MPDGHTASEPIPERGACRSAGAIGLFAGAAALLLGSDLWLKHWAMEHARGFGTHTLIPRILAIAWTENHGAVFGAMQGQQWVFIAASVIAVAVIAAFFCMSKARESLLHLALALILAGAVGNLYDRIQFGFVRDMLYLFPGVKLPMGWSWPSSSSTDVYPWIFNLADAFLLIGIVLIIARSFKAEATRNERPIEDHADTP